MPISTKSTQTLINPLVAQLDNIESTSANQDSLINDNATNIITATNFHNNAGYQTLSNVNSAINVVTGNPPTTLNTLEKIVASRPYSGQGPYPYTLVTGARWDEEDSSGNVIERWFWNGTYWLSIEKLLHSVTIDNGNGNQHSQFNIPTVNGTNTNIFLLNVKSDFIQAANPNGSSFWRVSMYNVLKSTGAFNFLTDYADGFQTFTPDIVNRSILTLNIHFDTSTTSFFRFSFVKLGTAPNLTAIALLTYRKARL